MLAPKYPQCARQVASGNMRSIGWGRQSFAVGIFFAFKIVLGTAVLLASAQWMPVAGFAVFSQLLILIAFLTTIGTAGVQNGLIRQIAAAEDDRAVARELRAALSIWAIVAPVVCVGVWALATRIAILLTGLGGISWVVPWLALLAVVAGLGQLFCSVLTGTGRTPAALSAQAFGLLAGTLPALFLLNRNAPLAAALAFSAGQSVTALLAGFKIGAILRRAKNESPPAAAEIRPLLGFSGAFLASASIMPLTLLGLRSVYRSSVGLDALGYWLAANRISDINTQLLGLYMVQVYLPAAARLKDHVTAWRLARRSFLIGTLAMGGGLALFLLAPSLLIRLFLSAKFLPAAAIIGGYFIGDTLRVSASLASYAALSQRRLGSYIGLEIGAAATLSAILLVLVHMRVGEAPSLAYMGTYAAMAIISWLLLRRLMAGAEAIDRPLSEPAV